LVNETSRLRPGDRRKYEELQREVEELRAKLVKNRTQDSPFLQGQQKVNDGGIIPISAGNWVPSMQRLEDISLSGERIAHLCNE
jgi:hypothetical protein